ncbi:fumarylacetoacetate hydrolase family protein [Aromatoleum toluclasticum]|uniref:fumarylacetoacetate hydrolase family protein n=1 Tax=Aromatoleum toluclasticum TaxID=92003 RepID=UPI001D19125F|nr:fumarylacetoacetate hydrolase family protein [Aromatoleum toluclasticum]MCC4117720.1 fumarylacetoacetate hydrolase family protein [Aromatoleum toluclasticum]
MKLVRFGAPGRELPGLIDATGTIRDLSGMLPEINGAALAPSSLARLRGLDLQTLPVVPSGTRLGPPLAGIGKIVCIGLNYADHAREASLPIPQEPIVFMKAQTAISGPNDAIVLPPGSEKTDWELELVIAIGTTARRVAVGDALQHVAGYMTGLDISERYWQIERGGQWTKGKSFDTFAPIGPWLATADELRSPDEVAMQLEVNGERMQDSHSANMIFSPAQIISYVSGVMTLLPGDLIFTGTPAGVGMGMNPPRYLRAGDRIDASIAGLGEQQHAVVAD